MLSPPAVPGEERLQKRRRLAPHPLARVETLHGLLLGPPGSRPELRLQLFGIELEVDRAVRKRKNLLLQHRLGHEDVPQRRRGDPFDDRGDGVLVQQHVVEEGDVDRAQKVEELGRPEVGLDHVDLDGLLLLEVAALRQELLDRAHVDHLGERAVERARALDQVETVHSPEPAELAERVGAPEAADQVHLLGPNLLGVERRRDSLVHGEATEGAAELHGVHESSSGVVAHMIAGSERTAHLDRARARGPLARSGRDRGRPDLDLLGLHARREAELQVLEGGSERGVARRDAEPVRRPVHDRRVQKGDPQAACTGRVRARECGLEWHLVDGGRDRDSDPGRARRRRLDRPACALPAVQ